MERNRYYKLKKFPDFLFERESFYDSVLKLDETIAEVAMKNSIANLKEGICDWFQSEGFTSSDFQLSKGFKENTLDHEDISNGHLRCEGLILISNVELFLRKAKVPAELVSQITSKIEIKSTWNRLNINFTSKLDNKGHEKVMWLVRNHIETPISFELGEGFELRFYKNMGKILKAKDSKLLGELIIKAPKHKTVGIINKNSDEYQLFISKVENLWLTRKLSKTLDVEESKTVNRISLKI